MPDKGGYIGSNLSTIFDTEDKMAWLYDRYVRHTNIITDGRTDGPTDRIAVALVHCALHRQQRAAEIRNEKHAA